MTRMDNKEAGMLREKADDIRALALKMFQKIGKGHVGGAMSIAETLSVLYFKRMNIDPKNPQWADRDRLVPVSYTHLDVYKRQDYNNKKYWSEAPIFSPLGFGAAVVKF